MDFKSGQVLGITNQSKKDSSRGNIRDFKSGQTDCKSRISNRAKIFQIGAEIVNRGISDFKSGQGLQIEAEITNPNSTTWWHPYEYRLILLTRALLQFIHTSR